MLITITPTGALSFQTDTSVPSYDGVEDTLVGVVNHSGATVYGISLSGSGIFGFDGDGVCLFPGGPACGAYGYEGPDTSFQVVDQDNGVVNFTKGLDDGQSLWFSLEGAPTQVHLTHTITVDPGHGGPTCPKGFTGTTGPTAAFRSQKTYPNTTMPYADEERNIALDIGLQLQTLLNNNHDRVVMTRTSTAECPSLQTRATLANNEHTNLFVSIHLDGAAPTAHGSAIWYSPDDTSSLQLASLTVNQLAASLGTTNNGTKANGIDPPWANRYIYVIDNTYMAAVLAEIAFLTNAGGDESIMNQPASIGSAANGLYNGIEAFLAQ